MGEVLDTLFGGGQAKAYEHLAGQIREGMGARREGVERGEQAYQPYAQAGQGALGQFQQTLGQGADPQGLINQILGGYQESPYAKFQTQRGLQAREHAAAASGMLGSGEQQQGAQEFAQQVSSKDMQDYLDRVLGLRSQYLSGLGGLESQGFQSARDIGGMRAGLGGQLAGDFGSLGQAIGGQDIAKAGGINKLIGLIGQAMMAA